MPWGLEYTLNKMRSHMEAPWRWGKALLALACAATPHAMHHDSAEHWERREATPNAI